MSQPEHVKDPSVEFVKSRLLGAAAEAKFVRDPKCILWQWHSKLQTLVGKKLKVRNGDICNKWISEVGHIGMQKKFQCVWFGQ